MTMQQVTGPTTNPDYLPSTPTALEYRVHSPGCVCVHAGTMTAANLPHRSPSRKAVIPHSSPDLVYNIQYYSACTPYWQQAPFYHTNHMTHSTRPIAQSHNGVPRV